MRERFFCADAARARGDALAGTAPYGVVWILVEYRGGWPHNGFEGLDLDPETKRVVFAAAQAVRARVLLVRRHGRRLPEGPPRWAVLRYGNDGAHRQQWGVWNRDEDLREIVGALGAPGEPDSRPLVLVCAHGVHDACCAVRGRPAGRVLSEARPDLVWECTHVGGDRFAANVVVLPDGVYYGGLDSSSALLAVEEHLAGRIRADHLRGYTNLNPPQQAATAAVLRAHGPAGRHDYAVVETLRVGDRWRVRVAGRPPDGPVFDVEVRADRTAPERLTCNGTVPSSAVRYTVTSLRAH
ncbi:sucrase ferredoxin [Streptomyces fuscigenes]|uniref:sucrase ferredoxin n=1 Tax=Streptomyces fuscigenes TaxID=1528880 RepID=UPI001F2A6084|nr:sucrase ferredoxin [Streptomyces fuscigenes]MCF3960673.1 sucrase ferredoxin [Streptomyces fuscigenes]